MGFNPIFRWSTDTPHLRRALRTLAAAAAASLCACTPAQPPVSPAPAGDSGRPAPPRLPSPQVPVLRAPPAEAAGAASLRRIEALIGVPRCDRDEECRVADIGHRPCGGPEDFRAWSTRVSDAQVLESALERHADERRRWQAKTGELSTCVMLPRPGALCRPGPATAPADRRCELAAPGAALR